MKAEFCKYGPKHDYRGAHVTLHYQGRELIGTIRDVARDESTGTVFCAVQFFCGDWWPIAPVLSALEILEREYQ